MENYLDYAIINCNHYGTILEDSVPTITLKNIPVDLYDRVKQSAAANHRSLNSEIIVCLENSFFPKPIDINATLEHARKLREMSSSYIIDDDEFNQLKSEGRP